MERMGDILARTAASRARQARRKAGDASAAAATNTTTSTSTTTNTNGAPHPAAPASARPTSPSASRVGQRPRAVANRRMPLRALPARTSATSGAARGPARPDLLETPPGVSNTTQVAHADVAELSGTSAPLDDRILELPAHRLAARAQVGGPQTSGQTSRQASGQRPPDASVPIAREATGARPPLARGPANAARAEQPATPQMREAAASYGAASDDPAVCPICGGAGYLRVDLPVGDPLFGKPVPCECKERQLEERRRGELQQLSSFTPFHDKTFETFDPTVQGLREALQVAQAYAADARGWLVLSGPYGVGKTHLAAAIAHQSLAQGNTTFFSTVPDLLDHLRAAFAPSSEIPYDALFDKIREAFLVVLDDLGSENSTAWATEKLFQLINYRYNMGYPTVITTNDRLLAHMDERIRSRLSDIGLVRHVTVKAQDYRQRHLAGRRGTTGANGANGNTTGKPAGG